MSQMLHRIHLGHSPSEGLLTQNYVTAESSSVYSASTRKHGCYSESFMGIAPALILFPVSESFVLFHRKLLFFCFLFFKFPL